MAGRFKLQQNNMLEIRGLSRGSMMDHVRDEVLPPQASSGMFYFDQSNLSHLQIDSDEDDDNSTINGEADGNIRAFQSSPVHSDDTITASDTYWTGENGFGTGNTTERSSVYSWGDDEFDHQASKQVRQMFQAIEQMLFEGVLSGSTSLQHECREWMSSFPHLRILGKQLISPREEGFQSVPSSTDTSRAHSRTSSDLSKPADDEGLMIKGHTMYTEPVPRHLLPQPEPEGGHVSPATIPPPGSDMSYLHEEIIEQDGYVEEYLAYDIREMDDEENAKKYHVPRRRRLGFPPITPNACVKDTVLNHLFDQVWANIVSAWSRTSFNAKSSLLKQMLEHNGSMSVDGDHPTSNKSVKSLHSRPGDEVGKLVPKQSATIGPSMMYMSYDPRDYDDDYYNSMRTGIGVDRSFGGPVSHLFPSFTNPSRSFYPSDSLLPPSRGNYMDVGRHVSFASGRLSTAPHGNMGDMNSLNDLMKISQKKLQVRSDKMLNQNDDLNAPLGQDSRFAIRPSSSQFANGNTSNLSIGSVAQHLSTFNMGGAPSPFAQNNRPTTSKDNLPVASNRQPSATGRSKRFGKPGRLLPLDGAKTPKVDFDGFVKATKLTRPGGNAPTSSSFGGIRVNSPPHAFQPPPTAPNPTTVGSSFWVNQRLPPIAPGLESLHENSLLDVKKARGKTAHIRISSAIADDKQVFKGLDFVSRPNTTHTFRADNMIPKRATSVTPSNLTFGAQGNSITIGNLKSTSPSGAFFQNSPGSSAPYPQHSSYSPDNITGLAGITGKGISMVGIGQPSSPDEEPAPPQNSWGHSSQNISASQVRRKRPVMGFT